MVEALRARGRAAASWLTDAAVATALSLVAVLSTLHIPREPSERPADWLAGTLAVIAGGAMVLRRRNPRLQLLIVAAALCVYAMRDYPAGPVYALGPVTVFLFMIRVERRAAVTAAVLFGSAMLTARWIGGHPLDAVALLWAGWLIAATLGSEVARGRIEQRRLAEARRREAQSHQAETLRRQLVEERLRIARDLHDSVAHSMATINVQAGVAAHVIEQRPLAARDALEAIRATSGTLLDELAAMLRLLRADTADTADGDDASAADVAAADGSAPAEGRSAGSDAAPRHPTPDLTRLDALVESSRLAGLDVDVVIGDVRLQDISAAISTSAYRIVQEALTNVIRHSGTNRATVAVLRPPQGGLAVEVRDDGRTPAPATAGAPASTGSHGAAAAAHRGGAGMGLVGIRERADATGGHADWGPRPAGGFLVRVTWP